LNTIKRHAEDVVDFMTIHAGLTLDTLERLKNQKRLMGIVSRGGALLAEWMLGNGRENPLYEYFDDILKIASEYDVVLSLGDGLRPGCIKDATDSAQIQELIVLGELTKRAYEADVQVIIEGPGHLPIDQVISNVQLEKNLCREAPFYVLGPIVTDIAPGYDHIVAAIGGSLAAMAGADFLCYVTPCEHLGLPSVEDVREGVIASRIAAHVADISKGISGSKEWDNLMARARRSLDWEKQVKLSVDPEKALSLKKRSGLNLGETCSMCGPYCSIKKTEKLFACDL